MKSGSGRNRNRNRSSYSKELEWYKKNSEAIRSELFKFSENQNGDEVRTDNNVFVNSTFGEPLDGIGSLAAIIRTLSKKVVCKDEHYGSEPTWSGAGTKMDAGNKENGHNHRLNMEMGDCATVCDQNRSNFGAECNSEPKSEKEASIESEIELSSDTSCSDVETSKKNGCDIPCGHFGLKAVRVNERSENWERDDFPWSKELVHLNELVFGNKGFRANQRQIMNAAISQRDVFVMMPTGGGKSLCFQLPGILSYNNPASVTVVIMPLVALMVDQMEQLGILGLRCATLSGNQSLEVSRKIISTIKKGSPGACPNFLFVTPEKLKHSKTLFSLLHHLNGESRLLRFAIDEAHCVCQWGFDFRPDYIQLCKLREEFPNVPIIALTATATTAILNDVSKQLKMKSPVLFKLSFDRPNIKYEVRRKSSSKNVAGSDTIKEISNILKSDRFSRSTCIIYCLSRKECEQVSKELNKLGISSTYYHGSMKEERRNTAQKKWMNDEKQVMVATIAFGMGINKKDVRLVVHLSMPKSLENYYQESGRAGRDGVESLCILYYSYKDLIRLQTLGGINIDDSAGCSKRRIYGVKNDSFPDGACTSLDSLLGMVRYCEEQYTCRRKMILSHFGEDFSGSCDVECDNCMRSKLEKPRIVNLREISEKIFRCVKAHLLSQEENSSYSRRAKKSFGFLTLTSLSELLKGKKKNTKLTEDPYLKECFGLLSDNLLWKNENIQRLLHCFITNKIFTETVFQLKNGVSVACLKIDKHMLKEDNLLHVSSKFQLFSNFYLETCVETPVSTLEGDNKENSVIYENKSRKRYNSGQSSPSHKKKQSKHSPSRFNDTKVDSDIVSKEDQSHKLKEFRNELLLLRRKIANEEGISNVTSIASKEAIDALVENLPLSIVALSTLPGWGAKKRLENFGLKFISKVREFVDYNSFEKIGLKQNRTDHNSSHSSNNNSSYFCPIDYINHDELDKELDLIGL